eukprot:gene14565-16067_t
MEKVVEWINRNAVNDLETLLCSNTLENSPQLTDVVRENWNKDTIDRGQFYKDQKAEIKWSSLEYVYILNCPCYIHLLACCLQGFTELPNTSTSLNKSLQLFTSVRNHASGINQEYIEEKSGDYLLFCEDQEKKGFKRPLGTGVLIFDEVKVIAKVLLNMKNEKFIGLAMNEDEMNNLHDIFSALQSSEPVPAEYILQFLWRDFTSSFDVIGPYFSLKSAIDHQIITETLFETMRVFHSYGFKTSAVVCDGASSNLAAIKLITTQKRGAYGSSDACDKHKVEPCFRNPFDNAMSEGDDELVSPAKPKSIPILTEVPQREEICEKLITTPVQIVEGDIIDFQQGLPVQKSYPHNSFSKEHVPLIEKELQSLLKKQIAEICMHRNDAWAAKVKGRLEFSQDLHASDALYRQQYNVNFRTGKDIPKVFQTSEGSISKKLRGRPIDFTRNDAFLKVTFRSTAASVLHKFYEQPKHHDSEKEQLRTIETAATLIQNEIKNMSATKTTYPTSEEIQSVDQNLSYVPSGLQLFLKKIFVEKNPEKKIASIKQAIIQARRPQVFIAPLQIGIGVQMHHHFGSKFLIDSLNSHGFCSSYSEVKRFEKSAADCLGKNVSPLLVGQFSQLVADNIDHNTRTLDGMNKFHGMGMIQAITPAESKSYSIPHINEKAAELALQGKINIHYYKSNVVLNSFTYHKLPELESKDKEWKITLLWKVVWPLKTTRPN